jgi:hypothetical protein
MANSATSAAVTHASFFMIFSSDARGAPTGLPHRYIRNYERRRQIRPHAPARFGARGSPTRDCGNGSAHAMVSVA